MGIFFITLIEFLPQGDEIQNPSHVLIGAQGEPVFSYLADSENDEPSIRTTEPRRVTCGSDFGILLWNAFSRNV